MALTVLTTRGGRGAVPLTPVARGDFPRWLQAQPERVRAWLRAAGFEGEPGALSLLAAPDGSLERVFIGLPDEDRLRPDGGGDSPVWAFAACPGGLPPGTYRLDPGPDRALADAAALGWALGSYSFSRYRKAARDPARLVWPRAADRAGVEAAAEATFLVRDLINTPAADMGPPELAQAARTLGRAFGARVSVVTGDALLARRYPAIHAVGRAAAKAPRLIDLVWAPPGRRRGAPLPRVTICGKGVCFDTGGLDLKSAAGMKLMKKDMGGAAQALGLARMVMAAGLPVRLRVLIPAVENAVAGNAYHPLDVLRTRKGLTVEVGNTDAEGRIILADALWEAGREKPDLLLDFATLTGAARVALGTGLPALFTNDDGVAEEIAAAGLAAADPVWRLPLWRPYREKLKSDVADINNISQGAYGGAITAALFLEEFVAPGIPWLHLDFMGWNESARPGRPEGGEAQGMRAAFGLLRGRFGG